MQEDEGAEVGSFLLQSVSHFLRIKTVFCSESRVTGIKNTAQTNETAKPPGMMQQGIAELSTLTATFVINSTALLRE